MPSFKTYIEPFETALLEALKAIPGLAVYEKQIRSSGQSSILAHNIDIEQPNQFHGFEIPVKSVSGRRWQIIVLTRASGEPRFIRESCARLISAIKHSRTKGNFYPIVAATYVTKRAAQICREMNVGYLDLSGNCLIAFDSIFIEKEGFQNKKVEKRQLRSLFSARSSRVLRLLLENPDKFWHVQDLAQNAQISLGLTSKVKQKLLDLDFITTSTKGVKLKDPVAALIEWGHNYSYRHNQVLQCYAPGGMNEMEISLSNYCQKRDMRCALTLFSAANRVAPFVQGLSQSAMYVDFDLQQIAHDLGWKPVLSGANFLLLKPFDQFIFHGTRVKPEWLCPVVSDIQLYLNLSSHRGRGQEAAKFLLEQQLKPLLEGWEAKEAV